MFKRIRSKGKVLKTKTLPTGIKVVEIQKNGHTEIVVPHEEVPTFRFSRSLPESYVSDRIKYLAYQESTRISNQN